MIVKLLDAATTTGAGPAQSPQRDTYTIQFAIAETSTPSPEATLNVELTNGEEADNLWLPYGSTITVSGDGCSIKVNSPSRFVRCNTLTNNGTLTAIPNYGHPWV